MTQVTW